MNSFLAMRRWAYIPAREEVLYDPRCRTFSLPAMFWKIQNNKNADSTLKKIHMVTMQKDVMDVFFMDGMERLVGVHS